MSTGKPNSKKPTCGTTRPRRAQRAKVTDTAPAPDRFKLYELCAQAPARDVKVLRAIHGGSRPGLILGEDFCGTAALSTAWVQLNPRSRAVAVDHDAATLARAHRHPRVGLIRADVMAVREPADVIAVLNFSIAEIHERTDLVRYLRHAQSRLRRGGAFVCDIYGGTDAHLTGQIRQRFIGPAGERIDYSWEQRTADPFTGRVVNAMHFAVRSAQGRQPVVRLADAFLYDWRLWSVPELREAMTEAGFARTEIYARQPAAVDAEGEFHALPVDDPAEIGDSFSVYVVGRR